MSVVSGTGAQSGGGLALLSRGGGNFSAVVGEATSGLGGSIRVCGGLVWDNLAQRLTQRRRF